MFIATLKRLGVSLFIIGSALFAQAQQPHFIYLQTENGQPFYVKLNNKVLSSSSTGYLILPKLTDGNYKFSVGFPKKEFPEENFQIAINNNNEGFLLKNFGEKGWGLFNLQSFTVLMGAGENAPETVSKNIESNPFSKMLANVVKDSSILQKNEPVNEEPVKEVVSASKTDSVITIVQPKPLLLAPAKKLFSNKNKDGMEMVYIDPTEMGNDTIRIFIPAEKQTNNNNDVGQTEKHLEPTNKDSAQSNDNATLKSVASVKDNVPIADTASSNNSKQEAKIIKDTTASVPPLVSENKSTFENKDSAVASTNDEIKQKKEETTQPELIQQGSKIKEDTKPAETKKNEIVVLPEVVKSTTTNSDCKSFADNAYFLKLRKKMASENSDENMINIAKKAFHSKCFSTEQIKNLSFLFLTNEGKYRFFDEAYAFVSDSDQYFTLQSQLTDSYYINRFKAMIHK
ncbi:hypothetical protein FW778_04925 [Ginsengibacter hankyongi]|uniref:DUF4476 domain-containing protein n=1 Tax=Ginsengibacter hankyongi TaxID=2607284 RepID=A0A5J5IN77_9BACT|nr:DUF4476 domain-containing protein [Ginsengibacter hankyongi]KAA9041374.1 hypothetical protein FW778_04925 [Ginsengibacter hankyongi]